MASDFDMLARVRPRFTAAWSRAGRSRFGWLVPLAFLALPNCAYHGRAAADLHTGNPPLSSLMFCDIEDMDVPRHCADDGEWATGVPLTKAAVNLVRRLDSRVALDYSPSAIAAAGCPAGHPVAITFKGAFPTGWSRCLNCGEVIPSDHPDVDAACVALCHDITKEDAEDPPSDEVVAFCATHARASTNAGTCFEGACNPMGAMLPDSDPRRTPEPVAWRDLSPGVSAAGNTLTRTAPDSGLFDEGAAGAQTITHGDGYVEFVASETGQARALGLSPGAPPDGDPSDLDIAFGFRLTAGDSIAITENGLLQHDPNNPDPNDFSWGELQSGDRVRISVQDQLDGGATVTYWRLLPGCDGTTCLGDPLRTAGPAPYPFRVDASLRSQGATLTDVRIVRVK
jgi:hypothetical protein